MRTCCTKLALLALFIGGLAGSTSVLAQPFVIFGYTNQNWKYITNNMDGTGWEQYNFNDSVGWTEGPGSLGYEDTAATLTSLNNAGAGINTFIQQPTSGGRYTIYFRTHFNWAGPLTGVSLTFSNRIDDGGVYYLNGQEIFRTNMAPGAVIYTTLATSHEATGLQVTNIANPPSLQAGDNVLAVELHNQANDSSDLVLAVALSGAVFFAPIIDYNASSLSNRTVIQCRSTTLSVSASGAPPPTYQWFHDGNPITGATAASYTITNMTAADAGNYYVEASNSEGTTRSMPDTVVSYQADTTPPHVVYAIASSNLNAIMVVLDEAFDTNTTALGDIVLDSMLTDTNTGAMIAINSATVGNPTTLVLNTDPFTAGHGLLLKLNAVTDLCPGVNRLPETNVTVLVFKALLLSVNADWRYDDTSDTNPIAPNWAAANYDDSGAPWKTGDGPFDAKRFGSGTVPFQGDANNCRPQIYPNYGIGQFVGTCINLTSPVTGTNLITANFRTHFSFLGTPSQTVLQLTGKSDDGAIFYLNGVELGRIGMAAAPAVITRSTFATRTVNDTDTPDNLFFVAPASLVTGDNVLAVELHQVNITSSDLTMGYAVCALAGGPFREQARLTIERSGSNLIIRWNGGGLLQCTDNLSSPANTIVWQNINGATSPHTVSITGLHRFYRVVQ